MILWRGGEGRGRGELTFRIRCCYSSIIIEATIHGEVIGKTVLSLYRVNAYCGKINDPFVQ